MKFFVPLLLAAALVAGCSRPPAESATPGRALLPVRLAQVTRIDAPLATELTGTARPRQRATVAAKVMGTITALPVTLGQRVAAGDLLVQLSAPEIDARVAQARAQLSTATRELERERILLAKGAGTPDTVRGLEDRLALAQAQLREAETMLGYTQLRAPFAGVIATRLVEAGDLASPGQPLLGLDGLDDFQLEVFVPETVVSTLTLGRPIPVFVPASGARFAATIAEISSAADPAARAVLVKLSLPADATIRPGQFARVAMPGPTVTTLVAPADAVSRFGQLERVFVAGPDRRAVLRLVKTGARRGDQIEILSGLDAGESVVVAPPPALREGQPLEVRP